ncbi:hypothetical protein [Tepidiphilus olei]|uniref:hypothetical protein n=1 Tax=Tepidiphilus olei TaxID=2502184 RepID=UPI00115D9162|nr:hypothetical protein [Tepidiphilus olei]
MAEIFLSQEVVLTKTAEGLEEIERRSRGVPARLRRILILCDGRRPLGDIASILGPNAYSSALELIDQGLLAVSVASARYPPPASRDAVTSEAGDEPADVRGGNEHHGNATPSRNRRRSVAMARMYMFDMVHRLLGDQEEVARAYLREARSPESLLDAFHECLFLIEEISGKEMAAKVATRLLEMVPEEMIRPLSCRTDLERQR